MPTEGPFTRALQPKTLESLKETFRERLDGILNKELTVENIETFADEALNDTTKLVDDVLKEYSRNSNFKAAPTTLGIQEQENEAFQILGLPNIQEILERISEVKDQIDSLKKSLGENTEKVKTVITPPQEDKVVEVVPGAGTFQKKEIFPRLLTLAYILEHDFEIPLTEIKITEGSVNPNMMRKIPYVRVEIPELDRAVYICDEEGNASYVFDIKKLTEVGLTLEEIDVDDKRDKNSLIAYYPGIGIRIVQNGNWREQLVEALKEPLPKTETDIKEKYETEEREFLEADTEKAIPSVSTGELDPWRDFWTDLETGEHWGTQAAIAKKLNKAVIVFKKRISDERLKSRKIKIRGRWAKAGRIENSYCFEKIVELFPELVDTRKVEVEGEWRGYWVDPETGKHWAPAGSFLKKFGVNDWITIKKFARRGHFDSIEVTDVVGRKTPAYCYEDFLNNEEFMDFLTAPQANQEGEWKGFWIDDHGSHWATRAVLGNHFGVTSNTINLYLEKIKAKSKKVKSVYKEVHDAFALEDLLGDADFMEFVNMPQADLEGQWYGFWTDKETQEHWGTVLPLSKKLGLSRHFLTDFIEASKVELRTIKMKDAGGKKFTGYCYEEVQRMVNEKKI